MYFITGAYGFLGQYIVQAISQHDPQASLRLLVRRKRRLHLPIDRLPQVSLVQGTLDDPGTYRQALDGVDTVVHNAALVSFRKADEQAIYQANITGTERLVQAAEEAGCKNFIFISSISAIGRPTSAPQRLADEDTPVDLEQKKKDPYGYSKVVGEQLVRRATGMRTIILNPSVIIGPGSERVETILRWLRWLPVLPMIPTLNSFVDVRDVARAVVLALTRGRPGERYILTGWNVDQVTFARTALRLLGRGTPVLPVSGRALVVGDWLVAALDGLGINPGVKKITSINIDKAYSSARAREELGWQPQYSLEDSIADTVAVLSGDGKGPQ
jgi:dihydroflavonol-4-reductase